MFRMMTVLFLFVFLGMGILPTHAQEGGPGVSFRVVKATAGGVDVEWTREGEPPWLLGWHVEKQGPDGSVVRLTEKWVEAGLFDSPAWVYRFHDADSAAQVGERVSYRVVRVDPENREWASDFLFVEVEAKEEESRTVVMESPPAKAASRKATVGTRVRMAITNDGLFRVTAAQLAAVLQGSSTTAVSQAISQTNYSLTCGGSNVAWRAEAGGAAILFFGQAYRDVYTDRNVYWLDSGPGVAMSSSNGATAGVAENPWFWETTRMEKDLNFSDYLPGDAEDDYFVWTGRQLTSSATNWLWTTNVPVVDIHPNVRTGTVTAYLISAWDGAVEFDNHTRLAAAGQWLDDRRWAGDERIAQTGSATNLSGTSVSVTVEMRRESDVTTTTVMIDALEVRYARRMKALNNQLLFGPESGTNTLTVRGFSTSAIRVWDVTAPLRPVEIATTVAQEGAEWRTSWAVSPSSTGRYVATASFLQPETIDGVPDGGWASPQMGAPHLVIASRALTNAAAALVAHRRGQGLSSLLVPFEELCDAFAEGRRDPRVIPQFLAYAKAHWTMPPIYVCLAGDGHLDYYDSYHQSLTRPNHVPPMQDRIPYSTPQGSTLKTIGLDNPLADTDGDGVPDCSIGRLPAQTSATLTQMINRMVTHERNDLWKNKVLVVTDKDVNNAFGEAGERVLGHVPLGMDSQRLNHTTATSETVMRSQYISAMNSAPLVSVYLGHANNVGISSPYFFEHSYIRSYMSTLTNVAQNPLLLAGTCMLNDFSQPHPDNRCLGKGFLDTASGGAVAVWATAAESTLPMAEATTSAILDQLFNSHSERLGNLIETALVLQAGSASPWMVRSSVLMGDPGMRIRTNIFSDQTPPAVAITGPTSSATFNTQSNRVNVSGTASDLNGVLGVFLLNSRTGLDAMAVGTSNWSFQALGLMEGTNSLSAIAYDVAGNSATATVQVVYSPVKIPWDDGYQSIGGDWRRLTWFGDYIPMGVDGWIWHNQHGFFFVSENSLPENIWIYAMDMGWLWTSSAQYPYLFRYNDEAWLWYNGATNPRWFFNLTTRQWENRP